MTEWQSIETAPRDGTPVLLYAKTWAGVEHIWIASQKDGKCVRGMPTGWEFNTPSCFVYRPQCWMPLPEPPLGERS